MAANEPAFPVNELNQQTGFVAVQHMGITIRDYFAAKVIQGICASPDHLDRIGSFKNAAECAYALADSLLKARNPQ